MFLVLLFIMVSWFVILVSFGVFGFLSFYHLFFCVCLCFFGSKEIHLAKTSGQELLGFAVFFAWFMLFKLSLGWFYPS